MFEVVLPVPTDSRFWYKGGRTELLESYQGRVTSTGRWYHAIYPTDYLCAWLLETTKSWAYCHEFFGRIPDRAYDRIPNGLLFGFTQASDAVLFKLTWGGQ